MTTDPKIQRIHYTMQTDGWWDIMLILDEMIEEPREELHEIMVRHPETLTGRTAIAKANRSRGLSDFKDEIYAACASVPNLRLDKKQAHNPRGLGPKT